jgi:MFS family permease
VRRRPIGPRVQAESTTLVLASAAQAAVSFVIVGLPAIGPQLRQQFALSLPELGALLAMMQLGTGAALIVAGRSVDRWGARATTLAGTGLAALGLVVAAATDARAVVFVGLFLGGIGAAIVPVSGANAIFRTYPGRRRAWALSVRQMGVPVGGIGAAVAMPALEAAGGARLVFSVGAVVIVVIGTAFAAASDDIKVRHEAAARRLRTMWGSRGLGYLLIVTLSYVFVLQVVLVYTVPAMRAAGFSRLEAGVAYFVVNVTAIVSRLFWGRVADGGGGTRRRRTLVESGLVASIGAMLFGAALHAAFVLVVLALVVYSFAALGWNAVVYTIAGEWTRPALSGQAFAVAATVVFAASAVASPAIGGLVDWLGWDATWLITGAVGVAGAAAAWALPDRGAEQGVPPVAPLELGDGSAAV